MSLLSLTGAAFVVATFAAYWLLPARFRQPLLVIASYVFYAWYAPAYAVLLFGLTAITWWVGLRVVQGRARPVLAGGVAVVLAVLAFFKYTPMGLRTLNLLLAAFSVRGPIPVPEIALPLGISFVAFGLVHFLVELHRGRAPVPSFWEFVLYVAFFPTVTNGPIKRYPDFIRDLREAAPGTDWEGIAAGMGRILLGLVRKFVVADTLDPLTRYLFDKSVAAEYLLVAVLAYTIKIYFDFAGYSDIAIGLARIFGFRIMENFDSPYLRRNISQFWRHWHMSLTRFLTENVYIPLGGSRRPKPRILLNLVVTMLLSGLWHGAAWHFVAWGLYHGVGMAVLRIYSDFTKWLKRRWAWLDELSRRRLPSTAAATGGWLLTFNYVAFGWVLFVLPLRDALDVYTRIFAYFREVLSWIAGGAA